MNLDELFAQPMTESSEDKYASSVSAAAQVKKNKYHLLHRYGNVTSYSTQQALFACPRLFMINKMSMNQQVEQDLPEHRYANVTFAFGHAVGAGVAVLDEGKSLEEAILATFLAWDIDLFSVERKNYKGKVLETGKSFHEAVWAVMAYKEFRESELDEEVSILDYECVDVEGEILVDFENGHFYTGHIDSVLRSRTTGRLKIKENKTDGSAVIDPTKYANSEQALSYAVVAQQFGEMEFDVLYTVYSVKEMRWVWFEFPKYTVHKAEWIQDQLLIGNQIDNYAEVKLFPKRGSACMRFNRQCDMFQRCDVTAQKAFGKEYQELPQATKEDLLAIEDFKYNVCVSDIVKSLQQEAASTYGEM